MHIYEIITEQAVTMTPGGIAIPAGSRTAAPLPGPQAAPNTGPQISRTRRAVRSVAGTGTKASATLSRAGQLVDKYILTKNLHGEVITSRMGQALGSYLRIIKYLGFLDIAVLLWQQKIAIEGLVAEKQISKADGDALMRQQYEKMAVAIMATGAFAKFLRLLKYIPIVKWVVRIAAGIATGATLGALGGPSVMFALATEVGLIFLTKYLASEEGQKALAYFVVNIMDPGVVWLWNEGPGKLFGAWNTASPEAQAKADATIKGKDTPAAGANVGGKPATNADGKTDIDSSSSKPQQGSDNKTVPAYDQSGKDLGWSGKDKYFPSAKGTLGPTER